VSRKVFPDEGSRLAYRLEGGAFKPAPGAPVVVYSSPAGTTRADIRYHDGTATPGAAVTDSTLVVDAASTVPLFWGPEGADAVWVRVSGGPLTPVSVRNESLQTDVNLALALGIAL
jgi:hypothetical protein